MQGLVTYREDENQRIHQVKGTVLVDLSELRVVMCRVEQDEQECGSLNLGLLLSWYNSSLAGTLEKLSSHMSLLPSAPLPVLYVRS